MPQKRFGNAQVRGRADGQKLGQTFDDAQQDRQQVVVQMASSELQ